MRTRKTLLNSIVGILSQTVLMIFSFWVRKIFIDYLGTQFLGINSVYTSLLQFLNLAELGISSAIIFNLYGPLAKGNESKITYLMLQYKKIYQKIGWIILGVGIILMFFIDSFMEGITLDIGYLRLTFFVQLLGTVSTYFFAYKRSLLLADQKNYICQIIDTVISLISYLFRIAAMIWFKSFVLYLVIQVIQNVLSNILCSVYCDKMYPYLKKGEYDLSEIDEITLNKDIGDVAIYKISSFIYTSSDSLIISKFISTVVLGIYSNYKLIIDFVCTLLAQITNSVLSSLGNYINDGKDKNEIFQLIDLYTFICFVIGSFCCVAFLSLFQPTISIWLGNENLLPYSIVIISCVYFFLRQIRTPIGNLYYALGMYRHDKIGMMATAVINIVLSILFAFKYGLVGVYIGTAFADLFYLFFSINVIFSKYFNMPYIKYVIRVIMYFIITVFECIISVCLVNTFFDSYGFVDYICRMIVALIIPNLINFGLMYMFKYKNRIFELYHSVKGGK